MLVLQFVLVVPRANKTNRYKFSFNSFVRLFLCKVNVVVGHLQMEGSVLKEGIKFRTCSANRAFR